LHHTFGTIDVICPISILINVKIIVYIGLQLRIIVWIEDKIRFGIVFAKQSNQFGEFFRLQIFTNWKEDILILGVKDYQPFLVDEVFIAIDFAPGYQICNGIIAVFTRPAAEIFSQHQRISHFQVFQA